MSSTRFPFVHITALVLPDMKIMFFRKKQELNSQALYKVSNHLVTEAYWPWLLVISRKVSNWT